MSRVVLQDCALLCRRWSFLHFKVESSRCSCSNPSTDMSLTCSRCGGHREKEQKLLVLLTGNASKTNNRKLLEGEDITSRQHSTKSVC
mmetsp:Transcript_14316/g.23164  ORF Transcript_14316/g.23164 Transcript_14316/m.23164 type:complete len:88 (+) Transcript_14316:1022-1285(+)